MPIAKPGSQRPDANGSSRARSCRFLYVIGQLGPGGSERQLCYLLQVLDRDRYRPEVVVWNFNKEDVYVTRVNKLGVPLHCFPSRFTSLEKLAALRRLILIKKPEIIHSYSFYTNFAAWWAALGTNTIAIGAVRSRLLSDKSACGLVLGNLCARWPAIQIYNNEASAGEARRCERFFAPRKVAVIRNGLDLRDFQAARIPTNGPVCVLGIGSMLPVKRWDRLLQIVAALKERGFGFRLELAGDGPLRGALEEQARNLDVTDRVIFRGYTDDVPALLCASTFLAHTSDFEGCPNVVMEAMASGRSVVATDVGDIPHIVEDGKTGFVVRCGDDETFVQRMATLISDRDLCQRMGDAARAKAERDFALSRVVSETFSVYRAAGWTNC